MPSTKAMQRIRLTRSITRLTAHTENLKKRLENLGYDEPTVVQRAVFRCQKCSRKSRLKHWGFIQQHFYVRPHGCTEGDYWKARRMETCYLVCPKCEQTLYIYNYPDKKRLLALFNEEYPRVQGVFAFIRDEFSNS